MPRIKCIAVLCTYMLLFYSQLGNNGWAHIYVMQIVPLSFTLPDFACVFCLKGLQEPELLAFPDFMTTPSENE